MTNFQRASVALVLTWAAIFFGKFMPKPIPSDTLTSTIVIAPAEPIVAPLTGTVSTIRDGLGKQLSVIFK